MLPLILQNANKQVEASTLISLAVKLGASPSPYTYNGAVSVGAEWIGSALQANFVKDQTTTVSFFIRPLSDTSNLQAIYGICDNAIKLKFVLAYQYLSCL